MPKRGENQKKEVEAQETDIEAGRIHDLTMGLLGVRERTKFGSNGIDCV